MREQWHVSKHALPDSFRNWPCWKLPTCRKWLKYPKSNNAIPDSSPLWNDPTVWACVSHYVWPDQRNSHVLSPRGQGGGKGKYLGTKPVGWQGQDDKLKSWASKPRREGVLTDITQKEKNSQSSHSNVVRTHSSLPYISHLLNLSANH